MTWTPTMILRARQGETWDKTFILEQQWSNERGQQEWRPIPKVRKDGTPYEELSYLAAR